MLDRALLRTCSLVAERLAIAPGPQLASAEMRSARLQQSIMQALHALLQPGWGSPQLLCLAKIRLRAMVVVQCSPILASWLPPHSCQQVQGPIFSAKQTCWMLDWLAIGACSKPRRS